MMAERKGIIMNLGKKKLISNRFLLVLIFCSFLLTGGNVTSQTNSSGLGQGYEFTGNGKIAGKVFAEIYEKSRPEFSSIEISEGFRSGIRLNSRVLKRISAKTTFRFGSLNVSGQQLRKVGQMLEKLVAGEKITNLDELEFYQIKGEDSQGNVHFTGYFTPRLEAREKADEVFRYPIYSLPKGGGKLPSRKAIDQKGALAGKGLELAYTNSLLDNFFLSVQGSGILDFGSGKVRQIGYAGSNRHPYKSLGKMLVSNGSIPAENISLRAIRRWFEKHPQQLVPMLNKNPSYSFFKWRPQEITGAAGVPLAAMHSVAVDKNCIPYGACLLAEVPVLDDSGKLLEHHWRILFAHDTGGAIRGPGHLDLFFGQGCEAGDRAGDLHHYGRVWLLLPR